MYLVIEMQKNGDAISALNYSYNTIEEADSKYHTILAAAAISKVPKHGAVLIDEECHMLRNECYIHE